MKVKNMSIDFEQSVNKRRKVQASCNKHDGKFICLNVCAGCEEFA